jgi:hypothetical protein
VDSPARNLRTRFWRFPDAEFLQWFGSSLAKEPYRIEPYFTWLEMKSAHVSPQRPRPTSPGSGRSNAVALCKSGNEIEPMPRTAAHDGVRLWTRSRPVIGFLNKNYVNSGIALPLHCPLVAIFSTSCALTHPIRALTANLWLCNLDAAIVNQRERRRTTEEYRKRSKEAHEGKAALGWFMPELELHGPQKFLLR